MVTNIHYKDDNLDTDEANKMAAIIHYKGDNLGTSGITNKMVTIIH